MSEAKFKEWPRFERIVNTIAQEICEVGDGVRDYEQTLRVWTTNVSDRQWVKVFETLGSIEEQGARVRVRLNEVYRSFDAMVAEGGEEFDVFCRDFPEIVKLVEARRAVLNPVQTIINALTKGVDDLAAKQDGDVKSD